MSTKGQMSDELSHRQDVSGPSGLAGAHLDTATHRDRLLSRNAGFIRQRDEPHGPLPDESGAPVAMSRGAIPTATAKVRGSDVELGNFVFGLEREEGTGAMASRALLREIEGLPWPAPTASGSFIDPAHPSESPKVDPQDWGRKYLPSNGGAC